MIMPIKLRVFIKMELFKLTRKPRLKLLVMGDAKPCHLWLLMKQKM